MLQVIMPDYYIKIGIKDGCAMSLDFADFWKYYNFNTQKSDKEERKHSKKELNKVLNEAIKELKRFKKVKF